MELVSCLPTRTGSFALIQPLLTPTPGAVAWPCVIAPGPTFFLTRVPPDKYGGCRR